MYAYLNQFNPRGRIHFSRDCDGLDRTNPTLVSKIRIARPRAALRYKVGDRLPCRRCALSLAACDLLAHPIGTAPAMVALASLPAGRIDHRGIPEISDSGTARLAEIADAGGWRLTHTAIGPVAWGRTSEVVARALIRNLFGVYATTPVALNVDSDDTVNLAVMLLVDERTDLQTHRANNPTLWQLATAIAG